MAWVVLHCELFLRERGGYVVDECPFYVASSEAEAVEMIRTGSGSGGMTSKLRAAAAVTSAGGFAVLARGERDTIPAILRGEPVGPLSVPRGELDSRKRWLQGLAESGRIVVDAGGERAVRAEGRSLLAVGIVACEGGFQAGDGVLVVGPDGPVAKGLANYGAEDVRRILARKTSEIASILGSKEFDEVVHRDHLALL